MKRGIRIALRDSLRYLKEATNLGPDSMCAVDGAAKREMQVYLRTWVIPRARQRSRRRRS